MYRSRLFLRILNSLAAVLLIVVVTTAVFLIHGKALTAGLIALISVMLIAFRFGFIEAILAALTAVGCLDFFYMPPVFSLHEHDPQDWISSLIFVVVALTAGHFVTRLQAKTAKTELERTRLKRLYLTSRDINLFDPRNNVLSQLSKLIADTFAVSFVGIWDARAITTERRGVSAIEDAEIKAIYYENLSTADPVIQKFTRVLR